MIYYIDTKDEKAVMVLLTSDKSRLKNKKNYKK